jgi:hypothetical protein
VTPGWDSPSSDARGLSVGSAATTSILYDDNVDGSITTIVRGD